MIFSSVVLLATVGAVCNSDLERAVASKLPKQEGSWLIRCLDDRRLELTRLAVDGTARARVVTLDGVTETLRVEVVVLAAQVLLQPARAGGSQRDGARPDEEARRKPEDESSGRTASEASERRSTTNEAAPASGGGAAASNVSSPVVDVLVVPGGAVANSPQASESTPAPPARNASTLRPFVAAHARWFPAHGTWLAGVGGGASLGRLRLSLEATGSSTSAPNLGVRLLGLQAEGSYAVACIGREPDALCARMVGAAGAAIVSGSPESDSITARDRVSPLLTAASEIEGLHRFPAVDARVALRLGVVAGPRSVVDGAKGPTWAGLELGLGLNVGW